jgi:hypothetical protein
MFAFVSHFHPSLTFTSKVRSLPLEWTSCLRVSTNHTRLDPIRVKTHRDYTLRSLTYKYWTRVEVTDSGKHSNLLWSGTYKSQKDYNMGL